MRASRGWAVVLGLTGLLALALLAGCGKKQIFAPEIGAPETYVFVQFSADTDSVLVNQHKVNHLVHLYWYGTYAHGEVAGYRYRFLYPGDPLSKPWTTTTATDQEFAVYTPDGVSTPVFQVAAYALTGADTLVDLTPAQQRFAFNNVPPTLTLTSAPRSNDTTFASLTLAWTAADPDGNSANMRFRVWLGSDTTDVRIASASPFTLPSDLFYKDSTALTRRETVWVQPIDDGGMLGTRVSANWIVRRPLGMPDGRLKHGQLLVVDDLPSPNQLPSRALFDSIYINSLDRLLPGQYDLIRSYTTQPFKSAGDVEQTFRLFDAVIWYRGPQASVSTVLQTGQPAIENYLEAGGRFYVEALNLFSGERATGTFTEDFVSRFLGSSGLVNVPVVGRSDSTADLSIDPSVSLDSPRIGDSLLTVSSYTGLRGFAVNDPADVLLWARAGRLSPPNEQDIAIGVTAQTPNSGLCAVVTIPLRGCDGYITAGGYLTNLLRQFLGPPKSPQRLAVR